MTTATSSDLSDCLIMIIDDNPSLSALFEVILTGEGLRVATFNSAESALKEIPAMPPPRVVLIDFSLPGLSGEECASKLSALFSNLSAQPKLVGFSSHHAASPIIQRFKEKVSHYIEKPSDINQLVTVVKGLL